ncbi:MAG: hypothetical protein HY814_05045 [Candidatus Riflebacteria bacterium]|nr:hypothetical protein [Candidatus Riflebacteria bacterium]
MASEAGHVFHLSERPGRHRLYATAALVPELAACILVWSFFTNRLGPGVLNLALVLHASAALLAALPSQDPRARRAFLIGALLFPPAAVLARFLDAWGAMREAELDRQALRHMLYGGEKDPTELWVEAIVQRHEAYERQAGKASSALLLAPVASLLNDRATPRTLKIAAVRNLTHLRPQDAVPLLRQAMGADEPGTRYAAAKLLTNLEESYTAAIKKAGEAGDEAGLALALLEHAATGLLDPSDTRRQQEAAVARLLELEEHGVAVRDGAEGLRQEDQAGPQLPRRIPLSPEARRALARTLFELQRESAALKLVFGLLEAGERHPDVYRIGLEAALRSGHYAHFRRLAQGLCRAHPELALSRELQERFP